jgi:hypothetical protein
VKHYLRHSSASGSDLTNMWDLDPHDGRILASIRVASGPLVHVPIAVASVRKRLRARQEFAIWCVSTAGDVWMVEHGCYDAHLEPPHPLLPPMSLCLSHAPENVARQLMAVVS